MKSFVKTVLLASMLLAGSGKSYAVDADIEAGALLYAKCIGCHSPSYHRTGPKHCGVLGRTVGSTSGFEFTGAMKDAGFMWTPHTLDQFLIAPLDMIPGTSMGFSGVDSFRKRRQLIAYLATLTEEHHLCR